MNVRMFGLVLVLVLTAGAALGQAVSVDSDLPAYARTTGVSGSIKSIGSDTMNNMMALWSEDFRSTYPSVQVEIEGKGSSTAPVAIIAGTSNFGPMSRAMKAKEQDEFVARFGYEAFHLRTADRHAGRLRPQGQPHRGPDPRAGVGHLLQDPQPVRTSAPGATWA